MYLRNFLHGIMAHKR